MHRFFLHDVERDRHEFDDHALDFVAAEVQLVQEFLGHAAQSIRRPLLEPVDDSAVDQAREFAGLDSEVLSNRREAQRHVQVLLDARNKEFVHVVLVHVDSGALILEGVGQSSDNVVDLVVREQSRDFSGRQKVVDEDHELLVNDL